MKLTTSCVMLAVLIIIIGIAISSFRKSTKWDYAWVHHASNVREFIPNNISDLVAFLEHTAHSHGRVCIKGAGYSHGGNTLADDSTQIDMRNLRKMRYDVNSTPSGLLTVEAGATWRSVLIYLATHGRTVAEMQSYHNFSVGGSVAVNCHGRGLQYGTISDTITSMRVCDASGRVWECSDSENRELFYGSIGGYASLGIIVEVTVYTVPNILLYPEVVRDIPVEDAQGLMAAPAPPDVVFFNAVLYPGNYDTLVVYSWRRSLFSPDEDDDKIPIPEITPEVCDSGSLYRFRYWGPMLFEQVLRRLPGVSRVRETVEPILHDNNDTQRLRSYVTATDAVQLHGIIRYPSTTVLQEYFVPVSRVREALSSLIPHFRKMNVVNVSLRYVKKATRCVLNYAPVDSVSIVLYVNVWNTSRGLRTFEELTDAMIAEVCRLEGRFYLPYLLSYDASAVRRMYGRDWEELVRPKKKFDPSRRFQNMMYEHMSTT
jgi:FAD/FMN-containing dehydrogenase